MEDFTLSIHNPDTPKTRYLLLMKNLTIEKKILWSCFCFRKILEERSLNYLNSQIYSYEVI